jgi:hypothetical protein
MESPLAGHPDRKRARTLQRGGGWSHSVEDDPDERFCHLGGVEHLLASKNGPQQPLHSPHNSQRRDPGIHDPDYELPLLRSWNGQTKEAAGLLFGALVLAPVAVFAPVFYATILGCTLEYYVKHKRAHLDPAWARDHLTWHYDHHMGPNQDANWCVTRPWFDHLLGTRVPYVGTEREAADQARATQRAARKAEGIEARATA